jgi:hypothetical protein
LRKEFQMNAISVVSNVVMAALVAATLVVVFLTTYRTMLTTCGRKTVAALALGVTLLAAIGVAQVIFPTPAATGSPSFPLPAGGALLFGFISLAVAELLTKLIVMAAGMVPPTRPVPFPNEADHPQGQPALPAEPVSEPGSPVKRRGRWGKQSSESPGQGHLDDLNKKSDPSKQPQGTGAESAPKQTGAKSTA